MVPIMRKEKIHCVGPREKAGILGQWKDGKQVTS